MKVTWKWDVEDAATPEEAALEAFFTMQRRGTSAVVFEVTQDRDRCTNIDLYKVWEDAQALCAARVRAQEETVYYLLSEREGQRAHQTSAALPDPIACESMLGELRAMSPPGTRFFRVDINPFAVAIQGYAPLRGRV